MEKNRRFIEYTQTSHYHHWYLLQYAPFPFHPIQRRRRTRENRENLLVSSSLRNRSQHLSVSFDANQNAHKNKKLHRHHVKDAGRMSGTHPDFAVSADLSKQNLTHGLFPGVWPGCCIKRDNAPLPKYTHKHPVCDY